MLRRSRHVVQTVQHTKLLHLLPYYGHPIAFFQVHAHYVRKLRKNRKAATRQITSRDTSCDVT